MLVLSRSEAGKRGKSKDRIGENWSQLIPDATNVRRKARQGIDQQKCKEIFVEPCDKWFLRWNWGQRRDGRTDLRTD